MTVRKKKAAAQSRESLEECRLGLGSNSLSGTAKGLGFHTVAAARVTLREAEPWQGSVWRVGGRAGEQPPPQASGGFNHAGRCLLWSF